MEQELDAELRDFLETAVEEKIQTGLSREQATRAARMELGSVEAVKDRVRDIGWESLIEQLLARRALREPDAAQVAWLCGGRRPLASARHRREYGDLQHR